MSRGESPQNSAREGVFYVNRATGALEEETVYGRGFMEFFYDTAPGRLLTNGLFSKPWFSRLYGLYNDSALSRRKIPKFVASLNLDWAEVDGEPGDFRSFNEFFARSLKPAARPLDPDPRVLISPADARIYVFPKINEATLLPVKGAAIPIAELLADSAGRGQLHRRRRCDSAPLPGGLPSLSLSSFWAGFSLAEHPRLLALRQPLCLREGHRRFL